MRIRTAAAGVALCVAVAFAAGCSKDEAPSAGASGAAATDGAAANAAAPGELSASFTTLTTNSHRYTRDATLESGAAVTAQGSVDPAAKTAALSVTTTATGVATTVQMLVFDKDVYLKYPVGAAYPKIMPEAVGQGKWLHLDATRITLKGFGIDDAADPSGGAAFRQMVNSVEKAGDHQYSGTLDFTKAPKSDPERLALLGDSATAVPFEATVDDKGRLVSLVFSMPAEDKDVQTTVKYSDYGVKVDATRPAAADVVEAPETMYQSASP